MKIGILGGGQLGLMLSRAARALGIEPLVLDPKPDAVARRVARHLVADYEDPVALDELAGCDVVTYEFENVPSRAAERLARAVVVRPPPEALEITGDRWTEKSLLRELGIPTARVQPVSSRAELDRAIAEIGLPAVLKTRRFGYDGKGQALLRSREDVDAAWSRLGSRPLVLEGFVAFEREVSVLAVRGVGGDTRFWPATENEHVDGILHISRAPARGLPAETFERACEWVRRLMQRLDYVGVLVMELFQTGDALLANEIACRVHNSGHWTIEGAITSQFENHVRAVAGLPLGDTALAANAPQALMVNLVGELPDLAPLAGQPDVFVHDYGKSPAPGRKLGHVTVLAPDPDALETRLRTLLAQIGDRAQTSRAAQD